MSFMLVNNESLQTNRFSQPGVKEKAKTLIIYNYRHVEVIKGNLTTVKIPAYLIDLPALGLDKLKQYISHASLQLSQLSNSHYRLLSSPKGLGRGNTFSTSTIALKLNIEEQNLVRSFFKRYTITSLEEGLPKAVEVRDPTIVSLLIKAGLDQHISSDKISYSLNLLVSGNLTDRLIARLLINAGASIQELEDTNRTSLNDALDKWDEELAVALIKAGICLSRKSLYDEPVLHIALSKKFKNAALEMIKKQVNVNEPNSKGESALAVLVNAKENWKELEFRELLNALIRANAKISVKDNPKINDIIIVLQSYKE